MVGHGGLREGRYAATTTQPPCKRPYIRITSLWYIDGNTLPSTALDGSAPVTLPPRVPGCEDAPHA